MTTMKPMLAQTYAGENPVGWLMSEKLDGVRAIWDGEKLVSRNGNTFAAPDWFTAALPAGFPLDGELYMGRGMFQETVGIVRRKKPSDDWKRINYRVFDAPAVPGAFVTRLSCAIVVTEGSQVASIVPHTVCECEDRLHAAFRAMVEDGAEGIMLRAPGSAYEPRRSRNLLKMKPDESDEGELVDTEAGSRRCAGMVGAMILKWRGLRIRVGAGIPDSVRANPPTVGSSITFAFCGLTDSGLPRFPVFLAERSYE